MNKKIKIGFLGLLAPICCFSGFLTSSLSSCSCASKTSGPEIVADKFYISGDALKDGKIALNYQLIKDGKPIDVINWELECDNPSIQLEPDTKSLTWSNLPKGIYKFKIAATYLENEQDTKTIFHDMELSIHNVGAFLPGTQTITADYGNPTGFSINWQLQINGSVVSDNITWGVNSENPKISYDSQTNKVIWANDLVGGSYKFKLIATYNGDTFMFSEDQYITLNINHVYSMYPGFSEIKGVFKVSDFSHIIPKIVDETHTPVTDSVAWTLNTNDDLGNGTLTIDQNSAIISWTNLITKKYTFTLTATYNGHQYTSDNLTLNIESNHIPFEWLNINAKNQLVGPSDSWNDAELGNYDVLLIPNTVTDLYNGCFTTKTTTSYDTGLITADKANLTLKFEEGSQLINIFPSAFAHCDGITSFEIPNTVESVGDNAFLDLNDSCFNIVNNIYYDKNNLVCFGVRASGVTLGTISLPNTLLIIANNAFYKINASSQTIVFPNSLKVVGQSSFYEDTWLTGKITFPENIINIGRAAFYNCKNVTDIEFDCDPYNVTLGAAAGIPFVGVADSCFRIESNNLVYDKTGVFCFGYQSYYASAPTGDVTFLPTTKYICPGAIKSANSVTSITVPPLVRMLPSNFIMIANVIKKVVIPSSVQKISNAIIISASAFDQFVFDGYSEQTWNSITYGTNTPFSGISHTGTIQSINGSASSQYILDSLKSHADWKYKDSSTGETHQVFELWTSI